MVYLYRSPIQTYIYQHNIKLRMCVEASNVMYSIKADALERPHAGTKLKAYRLVTGAR